MTVPYAVLDLRFSPRDRNIFAIAGSTGDINVFTFNSDSERPIAFSSCVKVCGPDVLILSLAWSLRTSGSFMIAASLSNGNIAIFDTQDPSARSTFAQAHSLEAWVVAWSNDTEKFVLYSGGDDSTLCRHRVGQDLGSENLPNQCTETVSSDTKTHGAGVTAILPLWADQPSGEELLVTGSYDEIIRVLILIPGSKSAKVLAEKRLGGGVWQIKQLGGPVISSIGNAKESRFHLLVSCMHAGCRVLEICCSNENRWTIEILARFEEHESMNYASDAQLSPGQRNLRDVVFVSTSFYDRKLCAWSLEDT